MQILHSNDGITLPLVEVQPLGTLMVFDQTELIFPKRMLEYMFDIWDGEHDEFYYSLQKVYRAICANMPEVTQ